MNARQRFRVVVASLAAAAIVLIGTGVFALAVDIVTRGQAVNAAVKVLNDVEQNYGWTVGDSWWIETELYIGSIVVDGPPPKIRVVEKEGELASVTWDVAERGSGTSMIEWRPRLVSYPIIAGAIIGLVVLFGLAARWRPRVPAWDAHE